MLVAGLEGKSGKHGDHGDHGGKPKPCVLRDPAGLGTKRHQGFCLSSVASVVSVFPSFSYFTKPSSFASGR